MFIVEILGKIIFANRNKGQILNFGLFKNNIQLAILLLLALSCTIILSSNFCILSIQHHYHQTQV